MKILQTLFLSCLLSLNLFTYAQSGSVKVNIVDCKDNTILLYSVSQNKVLLDSLYIIQGDTLFTVHWNHLEDEDFALEFILPEKNIQFVVTVLPSENIKIWLDLKKANNKLNALQSLVVEGSSTANQDLAYQLQSTYYGRLCNKIKHQIDSILKLNQHLPKFLLDSLQKQLIETRIKQFEHKKDYILTSKTPALARNAFIGLLVLQDIAPEISLEKKIEQICNYLQHKFPNAYGLQQTLSNYIQNKKITQSSNIENNFDINSIYFLGDHMHLITRDLKDKYILIDFWASWCAPCREESPFLIKAYQQFKKRNFEIYSVSIDTNKDKWKEAIEKDKIGDWIHVIDTSGWQSELIKKYNIMGIPFNLLISPDGKIIATNLRGEALIKKLEELLK